MSVSSDRRETGFTLHFPQLPREACFDLGDVKLEKDIVTFSEQEDEDSFLEEGPDMERCR